MSYFCDQQRYIPTLVGRFHRAIHRSGSGTVHPHACGEIAEDVNGGNEQNGTSPRLWGDSVSGAIACIGWRYIPTLVGRFRSRPSPSILSSVHPHACGEI